MKITRLGHLFKRGNTYHVAWRVAGKLVMRSTGETDRKNAEIKRREIMAPFAVGNDVTALANVKAHLESKQETLTTIQDERNPPLTIGDAWPAFIVAQNRPDTGKATLAVYELTWGRFWKWMKDNHPDVTSMRDVTPEVAGQFATWLTAEGRSPNTFNKYMNLLALVFRTVKEKARLTVNPWEGIQRKRLVTHGRRELTLEELKKVTTAASGDLRILLALGIYTGLRLGDCATLRWAEIDLARKRIVRIPNKTGRNNPKPVIVPIHPTLSALLADIPKTGRTAYVLPRIATDYARHRSYVTDRVQALFKACSIETCRKVEGRKVSQVEVGFHSLRHSFVSMCREADAPLSVVEAIVGHSNPAMTRHYTHTSEAAAGAAVAALPDITGKAVAKAELPAADPVAALKAKVRELAEQLTPKRAETIRKQLIELATAS